MKKSKIFIAILIICLIFSLTFVLVACGGNKDLTYELSEDGKSYIVTGCSDEEATKITIPNKYKGKPVTAIGESAFKLYDISTITIGNNVTVIRDNAFESCFELEQIILPDSLITIGKSAFEFCENLTKVVIPDSVESIGNNAFDSCENLTEVVIPNSVTSIGESAFAWCDSLEKITIGSSVETIGEDAFFYCEKLTKIDFIGTKAEWIAIQKASNWDYGTNEYVVYCTDGNLDYNGNEVA